MEEKKEASKIKWAITKIRHGLFLHGVKNRLAKIGIDIKPYYWVQEGVGDYKIPQIKRNASGYTFHRFGPEEIKMIGNYGLGYNINEMLNGINNGQMCIGLKHNDEIAAFMLIELTDFTFEHKKFKLKSNEAYLFSIHTMEHHRGNNLGPYLRYQSYLLLKEMDREFKYSISECFNKSTIRFKKKLNAKHLKLFIYIELFRRWHWNFLLRTYN